MIKEKIKKVFRTDFCNHCGEGVWLGSGKFVNRIPDLNDIGIRIYNRRLFPLGDFVCEECDDHVR